MQTTRILLTVTEGGMILYWIFASMVALEWILVSPEYMYSDYSDPTVVAWNWSFFPLDMTFAVTGLYGRFGKMAASRQAMLSIFSLSLMFCAGLMAISFWIVVGSYDAFWWGINLWLVILASSALMRSYLAGKKGVGDK